MLNLKGNLRFIARWSRWRRTRWHRTRPTNVLRHLRTAPAGRRVLSRQYFRARQVDRENAARTNQIVDRQRAAMRCHGPLCNRQAKPLSCPGCSSPLGRRDVHVRVVGSHSPTLILDVNQDPVALGIRRQQNLGARGGKLKGNLQQVRYGSNEQIARPPYRQSRFYRQGAEDARVLLRRELCGIADFPDQRGEGKRSQGLLTEAS